MFNIMFEQKKEEIISMKFLFKSLCFCHEQYVCCLVHTFKTRLERTQIKHEDGGGCG